MKSDEYDQFNEFGTKWKQKIITLRNNVSEFCTSCRRKRSVPTNEKCNCSKTPITHGEVID